MPSMWSPSSYTLRMTLHGTIPPIWRTFRVPANIGLADFHLVLQVVMGWTNSHLHEFTDGERRFGPSDPTGAGTDDLLYETDYVVADLLTEVGQTIEYQYDFGDDWIHTITLEAIRHDGGPALLCLEGARGCPPEDCGGPMGYTRILGILAKPKSKEYAGIKAWMQEMLRSDHQVEVCPIERINDLLRGGLPAIRASFGVDEESDQQGTSIIIPFPTPKRMTP